MFSHIENMTKPRWICNRRYKTSTPNWSLQAFVRLVHVGNFDMPQELLCFQILVNISIMILKLIPLISEWIWNRPPVSVETLRDINRVFLSWLYRNYEIHCYRKFAEISASSARELLFPVHVVLHVVYSLLSRIDRSMFDMCPITVEKRLSATESYPG
jgi:hypothetical protein